MSEFFTGTPTKVEGELNALCVKTTPVNSVDAKMEAEAAANYLFRHNANRILKRWWGARNANSSNASELAGDVLNLILAPDPWPNGPEKIRPYVVQQLGTALKVAKDKALDINEVILLARQDLNR